MSNTKDWQMKCCWARRYKIWEDIGLVVLAGSFELVVVNDEHMERWRWYHEDMRYILVPQSFLGPTPAAHKEGRKEGRRYIFVAFMLFQARLKGSKFESFAERTHTTSNSTNERSIFSFPTMKRTSNVTFSVTYFVSGFDILPEYYCNPKTETEGTDRRQLESNL